MVIDLRVGRVGCQPDIPGSPISSRIAALKGKELVKLMGCAQEAYDFLMRVNPTNALKNVSFNMEMVRELKSIDEKLEKAKLAVHQLNSQLYLWINKEIEDPDGRLHHTQLTSNLLSMAKSR